ncbi:hypothetical protein ACTHPH_02600 [Paenibacillus pasadenensis]|uniref:Uncharacterized protein n=1 Tax=Paenibacillus pasadenensis TaxID=217090 RepID=A0A2N5N6Z4_9BACL|nr:MULTISPECIES: hypothetical protein [Paenibacillus]PLT46059.1 hypothetical protein B8V81_4490 [Paenibacillus pasadenensis]QGG56537.1 hypothetical protein GE073_13740 [Paenibacillus sp. B01]
MNADFLPVRDLEGHLLLSVKKPDFGLTVSTRELVYHKPHVNYYLKLDDMVSLMPFELRQTKEMKAGHSRGGTAEYAVSGAGASAYRIHVSAAVMHNRSGRFQMGAMQFILPIPPRMLQLIGVHSGMSRL